MGLLSTKDRKILFELEQDARQSNRAIAKKIGLNVDVVRYRIARLQEKGVIHAFLTFVDFAKLGYTDYGVFITTQHLNQTDEKKLIAFIMNHSSVSYISKIGGKFDFIIGILARNIVHFNKILSEILETIGENILTKDIATRVSLRHYPRNYLYTSKQRSKSVYLPYFGGEYGEEKIDELDSTILSTMATNARITTLELSRKLQKPASTIALRIKKLQKRGVITGFFCFVSPQAYGYQAYDLRLSVKNLSNSKKKKLNQFFHMHPHIVYSIECVGKWDYEVLVEVKDQEEFQAVISEFKEHFSDVIQSMEFATMFKDLKYNLFPFE